MSDTPEKPKKKSLWEILNTPVQDLVKKDDKAADKAAGPVTAPPVQAPVQTDEPTRAPVSAQPASPVTAQPRPQSEPVKAPEAAQAPAAPQPAASQTTSQPVSVAPPSQPVPVPETAKAAKQPAPPEAAADPAAKAQTFPQAAEPAKTSDGKPEIKPEMKSDQTAEAISVSEAAPKETPVPAAEADVATAAIAAETSSDTASTDTPVETAAAAEERRLRKKSLWEILNTPVQDLFKEGQLLAEEGHESDIAFLGLGRDKPVLEGSEKQSWLEHFRARLARTRSQFGDNITRLAKGRTKVDEDMLEELEEILLQSDVGVKTTDDVLEHLRGQARQRRFLPEEVLPSLTTYLEQTLQSEPLRLVEGKLNIFLIVGVNGTGKTTTVGKVAAKLKISGYKVMMAAGDTFRAAAIDQLGIWGKRVGCPMIQHHEGADAAAVVYDAIQSARARKVDALIIDTAGRLHNKDYLMDELRKVHRIIEREKQDAHVENILVLDATTGQNGLRQAEVFTKSVPLNSLILTKLDGTAKGGVIFGIKRELGIPIKLLGVGEHLGDLQEFDPKSFVQALFAQDDSIGAETPAEVS